MQTDQPSPSLSVVIPAYNDEKSLPDLIKNIVAAIQKIPVTTCEILVVNDGSQDETLAVLHTLKQQYPAITIINHPHNRGYGATLTTGFMQAKHDYVFYTDGDNQFSCEELPLLFNKVSPDTIVIGYRSHKQYNIYRSLLSNGYNFATRYLLGLPYRDINCAFKIFPASLFKKISLHSRHGLIDAEIMFQAKKLGYKVIEVPVTHQARESGSGLGGSPAMIVNTTKELIIFLVFGRL